MDLGILLGILGGLIIIGGIIWRILPAGDRWFTKHLSPHSSQAMAPQPSPMKPPFTWGDALRMGVYWGCGGVAVIGLCTYVIYIFTQYDAANSIGQDSSPLTAPGIAFLLLLIGQGILPSVIFVASERGDDFILGWILGIVSGATFLSIGFLLLLIFASNPLTDFRDIGADVGYGLLTIVCSMLVAGPFALLGAVIGWGIAKIRFG